MTVKEVTSYSQYCIMNKHLFQNPQNLCVEELKIRYFAESGTHEEIIPALDQRWCNKAFVFTLYMPPPSMNCDGEFTSGSKEDWMERIDLFIGDTISMLQMQYHRFWSEVMFNKHFLDGLNSFLQSAPPFYLRDLIPQDKDILRKLKRCQKLVFSVLIRLTIARESEKAWMKNSTLGSILYDNFAISVPQLLDICLIYAHDNFKEVTELINRVIEYQPEYISDLEKSTSFICQVFTKLENQLNCLNEVNGFVPAITNKRVTSSTVEIFKLILLVLDIGYSLSTFIEIYPQAGTIFHENHLEARIASLYENITPELCRLLDSEYQREECPKDYLNYRFKLNLSRHQLILAVRGCLTSCMTSILDEKTGLNNQELKNKVEKYLNTISDCLYYHAFMRDYNSAYPIQNEIRVLSQICPDLDSVKCDFIIESVISLYDLPPKPQKPKEHDPIVSEASTSKGPVNQPKKDFDTKLSGVEMESLITEVKDILPHLGDGFIVRCLEFYNFVSAHVVNAVLENSLPDSLASLDFDTPIIPPEDNEDTNGLPERINCFDNDEFDIMTQNRIDTSRVHKGKRSDKHKNLFEMLDDKSHINQLRDVYTKLSLVECMENANDYEDEYDDTYDDVNVSVGNEGETEAEERRAFVIPRVLQQRKKSLEEVQEYEEDEDKDESEEAKADLFIENPADIRERAEQRRREMRGRGRGRARSAFPRHDVVGKPKGQGQDKEVIQSREFKNTNKASRANHNRRYMADKKRRQGMFPS